MSSSSSSVPVPPSDKQSYRKPVVRVLGQVPSLTLLPGSKFN